MSQIIKNGPLIVPPWMQNIISDSFESEIRNKIGSLPHYPKPIHNIGGLHVNSHCRIPGVQPFTQLSIQKTCTPNCLTNYCFEYGNTRFPPSCECGEKYDCRTYGKCCSRSNCNATCGSCNHNSNVIYH